MEPWSYYSYISDYTVIIIESKSCHCLPASIISSMISTYSEQYFSYIGAAASWNRSFSRASSSVTTHPAFLTLSSEVFSRSAHSLRSYREAVKEKLTGNVVKEIYVPE